MFTKLLRRNLIMMLFPILVMEVLIIFMILQLGILPEYSSKRIDNISGVNTLYKEGVKNISFSYDVASLGDPEYVGFDEEANGEKIGGYYYIYEGDSIRLFVLTDETSKILTSGNGADICASLEEDEVKGKYIESELSERLGLGDSVFDGFVDPVIINETSYPAFKIAFADYSIYVIVGIMVLTLVYGVIAFVFPSLMFGLDCKEFAKNKSELISMMNEEMQERLVEHEGSEYTTENYKIYAYVSHIEIIKR